MPVKPLEGAVLAGGAGTRLRPLTLTRPKALLPVAGQTLVEHNLARLAQAGVESAAVVVPAGDQAISRAVGRRWRGMKLAYFEQKRPRGTGPALGLLRSSFQGTFALCFADNVTPWEMSRLVSVHRQRKAAATLALFHAAEPTRHGIAMVKGARLVRLVEKPSKPPSDLASAGMFVFEPVIFQALARVGEGAEGEIHIPDAVQVLVDSGENVAYCVLDVWRRNVNTAEDLLESSRLLLNETAPAISHPWVRPPVAVGKGCSVDPDASVGPFVSMGRSCRVGNLAVVQDSILLDGATIGQRAVVSGCILGERSRVEDGVVLRDAMLADGHAASRSRTGRLRPA